MHNKVINLALVSQVALGLQELRDKMVFIGGAVMGKNEATISRWCTNEIQPPIKTFFKLLKATYKFNFFIQ